MSPKENPAPEGKGFSESRLKPTLGEFHTSPTKTSEKVAQAQKKEPSPGTQLRAVLDFLRNRRGQPVGVNEIMRHAHCAAAHSTISALRQKYGFKITNRQRRAKDGRRLSEYKLEEEVE